MIRLDTSELKQRIRQAREAVKDEPDPYKIEAFMVILSKLIEQRSIGEVLPEGAVKRDRKGRVPDQIIRNLGDLKYKERIQILLYYNDKALAKEEIREQAKELGVDEGWWNGSNFKRDLMKRNKILLEKKDAQGVPRYRLNDIGKAATRSLIERLQKP